MQNDEEKFTDNSEEAKEKRYQDSMNRMHTKKIVTICSVLAAVFAGLNIMMSQGEFDSIFLGRDRADEKERQEILSILEESLSESLAANASQSEEQTEKEDSIYKKISNKRKRNIPCFYITEEAEISDGWIMTNGIIRAADFENDMKLGIVYENQVQKVDKVYVNLEEDSKDELKTGKEITAQINIQSDNLDSVKKGSVIAPMENIHKAKDIVMYAYFFDSCQDVLQTGTTVYLDMAGSFMEVSLGAIKSSLQFDMDEVVKGQEHYIFITLNDEIYIIDNYVAAIYNVAGDYIGNAMLYEDK